MRFLQSCIIVVVFFVNFSFAQELPPIKNYTPAMYGAENQNWGISQANNNYIYIANNSGLLEFNGANWQLYPSPNNTIIRSVKVINDKIFTGCYKEFGFWTQNEFGKLNYTSLSNKLQEPLGEEEFWNILTLDHFIVFQSLQGIYIYDTIKEVFSIIKSKTSLPKVFKVDDSIYFQKIDEGIFKIENGVATLITNDAKIKNEILVNIIQINKQTVLQTQQKGLFILNKSEVKEWNVAVNTILKELSVYSSIVLADESILLGTVSNGVYHINNRGEIINNITQKNGLNNNTVLSMFKDNENNLWLGLDNGISVINFGSALSVFNDVFGDLGTIYASVIFEGKLYLGTNQGLFYKNEGTNEDFKFIEGTKEQVWCLKVIDNKLFCGHNIGTLQIVGTKAFMVHNAMGTWDIKKVPNNPNLLLQGNYNGLNVLEKKNGKWQFRNKIEGFPISSRYFELIPNNQAIVSHEYKGVFKLNLDDNYTKVLNYRTETSAPKSLKSSLVKFNNQVIYKANKGVYLYNLSENKFVIDSVLTKNIGLDGKFISGNLVSEDKTKTLWGFTEKYIVYFTQGKLNNTLNANYVFLPSSLRNDVIGYENIYYINDKKYLIGTSRGYFILDLNKLQNAKFSVAITSITTTNVSSSFSNSVAVNSKGEFKYKNNNISFSFSVPDFDPYSEITYQYQLKGMYDDWSKFSTSTEAVFKNLPYGSYTFNVRAKKGNIVSQNSASYTFKVKRPFILSNLMILIYLFIFIGIILVTHLLYKRYYSQQRIKIQEKNQRDLALAVLENEKKLMKLKNEQLNSEIESKNRELTISTMSIIKKNEILNQVKKELQTAKNFESNKQAIKSIDKNLNSNKDWEFLEEAFNTADKDFFKRIKKVHNDLTPNDLRFCAYLRLNLSSKEIAPLLNISVRSVEIKRYRLRKKMKLSSNDSLVDHILSI